MCTFIFVPSLYMRGSECSDKAARSAWVHMNPQCSHQLELPRPNPWNSVESDSGCTSRIYIDNVMLALHNVTLTSQKPCQHNNKRDCIKTNGYK